MTAHPHAENMRLYAEDAAETDKPWERWQVRTVYDNAEWIQCEEGLSMWLRDCKYRRKPKPLECWVIKRGRAHIFCMSRQELAEHAEPDDVVARMREVTE
jgi:hypothetical protein